MKAASEVFIGGLKTAKGIRDEIRNYWERDIRLRLFSLLLQPVILQEPRMPVPQYPPFYQDTVAAYAGVLDANTLLPAYESERQVAALRGYTIYLAGREGKYGDPALQYALAKEVYEGEQQEWTCYSVLKDMMRANKSSASLVKDFMAWISPGSKFRNSLLGIEQLNEVVIPSEAAVKDVFMTPGNRQLPLSEILSIHKGKVMYVDLWASWCMPCLEELPAAAELAKWYASDNFIVVYLSIDQDREKWLKATSKYLGYTSDSYLFKNCAGSGLMHKFRIQSIPRYMIIDKEGTVRYADAPKPSSPVLKEILNELLVPRGATQQ